MRIPEEIFGDSGRTAQVYIELFLGPITSFLNALTMLGCAYDKSLFYFKIKYIILIYLI